MGCKLALWRSLRTRKFSLGYRQLALQVSTRTDFAFQGLIDLGQIVGRRLNSIFKFSGSLDCLSDFTGLNMIRNFS